MRRFIVRQKLPKTFVMLFNSTEKEGVFDKPHIYPFHITSLKAPLQNSQNQIFFQKSGNLKLMKMEGTSNHK